ncbi:MAG: hypothetical protein B7X01_02120, partial [Acidiphilium sp. 21-62-4]
MSLGPRLDLRQTQSLVMTPQLRQAIQLLQFTNTEVNQFIEDELLKNPLIERDDGDQAADPHLDVVLPTDHVVDHADLGDAAHHR